MKIDKTQIETGALHSPQTIAQQYYYYFPLGVLCNPSRIKGAPPAVVKLKYNQNEIAPIGTTKKQAVVALVLQN